MEIKWSLTDGSKVRTGNITGITPKSDGVKAIDLLHAVIEKAASEIVFGDPDTAHLTRLHEAIENSPAQDEVLDSSREWLMDQLNGR
jgi:hypothetical protein